MIQEKAKEEEGEEHQDQQNQRNFIVEHLVHVQIPITTSDLVTISP
ncbi:unnamed protein product, partial [Arabidopsis halleri]